MSSQRTTAYFQLLIEACACSRDPAPDFLDGVGDQDIPTEWVAADLTAISGRGETVSVRSRNGFDEALGIHRALHVLRSGAPAQTLRAYIQTLTEHE